MKRNALLLFFLTIAAAASAQCNFYSPRDLYGGSLQDPSELTSPLACDSLGRIYNAHTSTGSVNLGNGQLSSGIASFLCGYDGGDAFWAKTISGHNMVTDMQVDEAGNIFVTGGYSGNLTVDSHTITGQTDNLQAYVMKFDSNRVFQWIRKSEPNLASQQWTDNDYGMHITPDENGGCFATIYYNSYFTIDTHVVSTVWASYIRNSVVVHFDSNGAITWLNKVYETDGFMIAPQLISDKNGGAYMVCTLFGNCRLENDTFYGFNGYTSFIIHVTSSGQYDWAQYVYNSTEANAVYCNDDGDLYLGGVFRDSVRAGSTLRLAPNRQGVYLCKVNLAGNVTGLDVMITSMTTTGTVQLSDDGLDVQGDGSFYLSGYMQDAANFNGLIRADTAGPMFVARFDNLGNTIWTRIYGGNGTVGNNYFPDGVRATSCNSVVVGGSYFQTMRALPFQFTSNSFDLYFFELLGTSGNTWISPVNVEEPENSSSFSAYPNPSTDFIHVNVSPGVTCTIQDLTGRTVLYAAATENGICISELAPGVYILTDSASGKSTKFVKE